MVFGFIFIFSFWFLIFNFFVIRGTLIDLMISFAKKIKPTKNPMVNDSNFSFVNEALKII